MRNGLLLILLLTFMIAGTAYGNSNWRYHGKVCGWDEACMRKQARAQELWKGLDGNDAMRAGCRQVHIKTYAKDYISAVACVAARQKEQQKNQANQAQVSKDGAKANTKEKKGRYIGRSGQALSGGKMVSY